MKMNDTVHNLAIQTVALLESSFSGHDKMPEFISISQYFEGHGINSEDTSQVYQKYRKKVSKWVGHTHENHVKLRLSEELCNEINTTLRLEEKIYLLLLVQDCLINMHDVPGFTDCLNQIFNCVGIDNALINRLRVFLEQNDPSTIDGEEYLLLAPFEAVHDDELEGRWIEKNAPRKKETIQRFDIGEFKSHVLVIFVEQIKSYVVRCMNVTEEFFDQDLEHNCRFRLLSPGSELCLKGVPVLTYSGLKNRFLQLQNKAELSLIADRVQYRSVDGIKQINTFTTSEVTGQLIGIVGKEGVGKSTLLKLFAGKIKSDSGNITINGYDLWKNKYLLKGIIGYVPEEDMLYEELTVNDNLSLTARLYYSNLNKREIEAKVNSVLSKLDLLELKHVVVGSILSKHIQPGQRRMINIALELLREPQILLVDNALSGLGMTDASKVIHILHDYSFSGNLVITTISQADSKTFQSFDKIWIFDEGGRIVYNGPVKLAPEYLHKQLHLAFHMNLDVDPSLLLDLVNYKLPDPEGNIWKRVKEPKEWHDQYIREQTLKNNGLAERKLLPARILKIPNLEIQLLIFSIRNFKCKFSRMNDILRTVFTGPIIALLISLAFRFKVQGSYLFSLNDNLPVYQFLSVIVVLFMGLILSSNEIIREKNTIEKEEYLEFSRFSYLNSKILYLFPVIALQTLLYVLTGNLVLGITELFWKYWIILFSTACFGILLGLTFSAGVQNLEVLYRRFLPFVIALQILLGGGLIPYERLNLGRNKYTPVLGDLMVSRWAYEALAVEQFKNNRYEKQIYDADKKLSQTYFYASQVIPKLEEVLALCHNTEKKDSTIFYSRLIQNELTKMTSLTDVFPFEYLDKLSDLETSDMLLQETSDYLTYLSMHFYQQYENLLQQKNQLFKRLADSIGSENFVKLKENYHNEFLEKTVTNQNSSRKYFIMDNEIIRQTDPVFQEPFSNIGRACLFCPVKLLNGQKTNTIWFNISVIWLFSAVCYLMVLFNASGAIRKVFNRTVGL
jgi:ABC-type multidrug transport system ATPase subunit